MSATPAFTPPRDDKDAGAAPTVLPAFLGPDDDWESDLAAWDEALPIFGPPSSSGATTDATAGVTGRGESAETRGVDVPASAAGGSAGAGRTPGAEWADPFAPVRTDGGDDSGADEFREVPTTVVSGPTLARLGDELPELPGEDDFAAATAPASGVYESLTTQANAGARGLDLFESEPPDEAPPGQPPTTGLPEIGPEPWAEDLAGLLDVGPQAQTTPVADTAYWHGLLGLLDEERGLARDPASRFDLALSASRVAERLDDVPSALARLEDALAIDSSAPAAHRARLLLLERGAGLDDDRAAESLARLSLVPHPDQAYYRALSAEWTLARAARGQHDSAAAAAITATPPGLARTLAEAELAWQEPSTAAALLESAAGRVGGALGAALLVAAANHHEAAGNLQAAAEQRFMAARLDERDPAIVLGWVRDVARLDPRDGALMMADLVARLQPSPFKTALARWGGMLARRAGDVPLGWSLLRASDGGNPGPTTRALARERFDLALFAASAATRAAVGAPDSVGGGVGAGVGAGTGAGGVSASTARLPAAVETAILADVRALFPAPAARVCAAMGAARLGSDVPSIARALDEIEAAAAIAPGATPLALAAESLAAFAGTLDARAQSAALGADDAEADGAGHAPLPGSDVGLDPVAIRARALGIWREGDPVRKFAASLALAETLARASSAAETPAVSPAATTDAAGATTRTNGTASANAAVASGALLRELSASAPHLPIFWQLAWRAIGGRRFADAVEHMNRGVVAWKGSPLAAPLAERAAELVTEVSAVAAAERLVQLRGLDPREDGLRQSLQRALRRARDPERWLDLARSHRADAPDPTAGTADDEWRAAALAEAVLGGAGAAAKSEVLAMAPGHPTALALALASRPDPGRLADRFVAASEGGDGARWLCDAALWSDVAGRRTTAVEVLSAADVGVTDAGGAGRLANPGARAMLRRLACVTQSDQRAQLLVDLATAAPGDIAAWVEAAEAEELRGNRSGAAHLFAEADRLIDQAGPVGQGARLLPDVRAGLDRVAPPGETGGEVSGEAEPGGDALEELSRAVADGRWIDVVARLADASPVDDGAAAPTLMVAAHIDEGRAGAARAGELWARARSVALLEDPNASRALALFAGDAAAGGLGAIAGSDAAVLGGALERLAAAAGETGDAPSAALMLSEAGRLADEAGARAAAEKALAGAVAADASSLSAWRAWKRFLIRHDRFEAAADAAAEEAATLSDVRRRVDALVRAAVLAMSPEGESNGTPVDPRSARGDTALACLRRAMDLAPQDQDVFNRLSQLYEERGEHAELADLLAARLAATANPFEMTSLHLSRAELYAGALGNRAAAKEELQAILQKEPHHARALARLADLEMEDDNPAAAAELEIRRAAVERAPERLREIFLRLGRIHTQAVPDTKRAVGAYSRVLQLEPNNREALDALSLLYVRLGETRNALKITERLAKVETDKARRAEYLVRLGQLAERAGDPRAAGQHLRGAVDEAPRDLAAVGELARFLERTRDVAGRRILLDRVTTELRVAVHERPRDAAAWHDLTTVLTWRSRTIAAQAAAELGEVLAGAPRSGPTDSPARRLVALADPAVDERTYPASVPSPLRQLLQLTGPVLVDGLKAELARPNLDRQARVTGDRPPRDAFAALAVELGLPMFELYVLPTPAASGPALDVVPARPPVVVLSDQLAGLGAAALRFMAAYTLRLASTQLHLALAGPESDFGALLAGIVRQYVPEYALPGILEEAMAARAARIARLLPKRMRQDLMPFAMECSGPIDLHAARAGVREAAGRAGLLASGSIAAALAVLAALRRAPVDAGLLQDDEARALIEFALSDDYDDLVRLMA